MKTGFWDYVQGAFSARPIGMFVPPNWVGLGLFGLLGLVNPGFWLVGLGLELAYLGTLASNERFQRTVVASKLDATKQQWQARISGLVEQLGPEGQSSYRSLESRCRSILEQQLRTAAPAPSGLGAQEEGLGRLLWIYLRLLLTRQSIDRIVRERADGTGEDSNLDERIGALERRLREESPGEDLKKSLSGQIEILQQRLAKRREAREKLAFLDAELERIREQVELVREQAVLATDPETVSRRIDQITTTLGGTTQWISEQQKLYGAVEDLMSDPPSITVGLQAKQSQ